MCTLQASTALTPRLLSTPEELSAAVLEIRRRATGLVAELNILNKSDPTILKLREFYTLSGAKPVEIDLTPTPHSAIYGQLHICFDKSGIHVRRHAAYDPRAKSALGKPLSLSQDVSLDIAMKGHSAQGIHSALVQTMCRVHGFSALTAKTITERIALLQEQENARVNHTQELLATLRDTPSSLINYDKAMAILQGGASANTVFLIGDGYNSLGSRTGEFSESAGPILRGLHTIVPVPTDMFLPKMYHVGLRLTKKGFHFHHEGGLTFPWASHSSKPSYRTLRKAVDAGLTREIIEKQLGRFVDSWTSALVAS
jgi:hypothetical protein